MRKCKKCGRLLELSEFRSVNGYTIYTCRECEIKKCRKYYRTKQGVINTIFYSQKVSSKNKNLGNVGYSKEELSKWILSSDTFHKLYDNWVNSNYDRWNKPSVDRLDDYKGYYFGNIRIVSWRENSDKGALYRIIGKNNKKSKEVYQYDLDGNFINKYYSMAEAGRRTGVCSKLINRCVLNDNISQAGGYKWMRYEIQDLIKHYKIYLNENNNT